MIKNDAADQNLEGKPNSSGALTKPQMLRVLVIGAGVIGSVYAGQLAAAGNEVILLARGDRLNDLQRSGLRLRRSGRPEIRPPVTVVDHVPTTSFDLVLIAVRRDQAMVAARQGAGAVADAILLFGNFAGMLSDLSAVIGSDRVLAGFPGVGGRIEPDGLVTYVSIDQQPTVVGPVSRANENAAVCLTSLREAGFETAIERDIGSWLASHAALVVPIAAGIMAAGGRADGLAHRKDLIQLAVRATKLTYRAQRAHGDLIISRNLSLLYLWMPEWVAIRYWSRALRGDFGELAFAAHTRHAWDEMALLATWLRSSVEDDQAAVTALDQVIDRAATKSQM